MTAALKILKLLEVAKPLKLLEAIVTGLKAMKIVGHFESSWWVLQVRSSARLGWCCPKVVVGMVVLACRRWRCKYLH